MQIITRTIKFTNLARCFIKRQTSVKALRRLVWSSFPSVLEGWSSVEWVAASKRCAFCAFFHKNNLPEVFYRLLRSGFDCSALNLQVSRVLLQPRWISLTCIDNLHCRSPCPMFITITIIHKYSTLNNHTLFNFSITIKYCIISASKILT